MEIIGLDEEKIKAILREITLWLIIGGAIFLVLGPIFGWVDWMIIKDFLWGPILKIGGIVLLIAIIAIVIICCFPGLITALLIGAGLLLLLFLIKLFI